jgi:hypothetical protein
MLRLWNSAPRSLPKILGNPAYLSQAKNAVQISPEASSHHIDLTVMYLLETAKHCLKKRSFAIMPPPKAVLRPYPRYEIISQNALQPTRVRLKDSEVTPTTIEPSRPPHSRRPTSPAPPAILATTTPAVHTTTPRYSPPPPSRYSSLPPPPANYGAR